MTEVNWLHLSDWHQRGKEFDRQVVCKALIRDIKERVKISPELEKIDFVIFSGDLAYNGKSEEYQKAKEQFLQPILDACGLKPEQLFIVPGNHDMDREQFELLPAGLKKPLSSEAEVQNWLTHDHKRARVLEPFQAFSDFVKGYSRQKHPDYADIQRIKIGDKEIALLGLNSAWMCGRNKNKIGDRGSVIVGEPQIHGVLYEISNANLKIAVLHHPFDWLAEFDCDRIEDQLRQNCDFILRGHQHKPKVEIAGGTSGDCVIIPAGSSYDRRIAANPRYVNSYNFVHLDLSTDNGIAFLRRWSDTRNIWLEDIDSCDGGKCKFSLHKSGIEVTSEKAQSSILAIPHQIPPPPRDFKGREQEIGDILSNFEKGATITGLRGMGGVGKTALALVIAERIKSHFPDGQIFIDMRGTSNKPDLPPLTPAEAMAHVIRTYHPADRLPESENELRGLYHSLLDGKSVLLLLDNAAGSEQVEPLLPPKGCSILITSRIKFTLPGLAEKDLDILPLGEACELLIEIAPRIEGRAEGLAETCGRLPLALRNAASVLAERKDLSVPEYERRLKDKVELLKLVKGSFSLSYELLTPFRKKHWRRLSVFPKDFDRNAATAVLKMAPGPSAEALSDLVRWSLVDFIPVSDSNEGRYRLHDLARLFAESCLEGDELTDAQQKHAGHYSKVLSQSEALYLKGGQDLLAGLDLFDREWTNIKAGQAWAKSIVQGAGELKKRELKSVLELANSYAADGGNVLDLRLHLREKIVWMETGLMAAKIMKDRGSESCHLNNLGLAYSNMGETLKAIGYLERALNIFRRIGNRRSEGSALGNIGLAYSNLGKTRRAIEYYEQALAISKEIGNMRSEGIVLTNLGLAYSDFGETRKAIEYYEQALAISKEIGDRRGEGAVLGNLGLAYAKLGETRKAIEYHEHALDILIEIGDRRGEGAVLGNLGNAYAELGETPKAIEYYEHALDILIEIGDRRGEGADLGNLGLAYADLEKTGKAIEYHEQALRIAREIGDSRNEGESLCNLGKAYLDKNDAVKTIDYCTQSLALVRKIEYREFEGEALNTLSRAYINLGQLDLALDHCDQALKIFREIEFLRGEAEALFARSLALDRLARREEAVTSAKVALQIFQKIESPKAEKVSSKLAEWGVAPQGS